MVGAAGGAATALPAWASFGGGGGAVGSTGGGRAALCTGATGALAGGRGAAAGRAGTGAACGAAVTAGIEALATAAPPAGGGTGGGRLPTPNSPGAVLGRDGSGSGAASSSIRACARSATSPAEICRSAARSGGVGTGGTVARFG